MEKILFIGGTGGLVSGIVDSKLLSGYDIFRTTREKEKTQEAHYIYFDINKPISLELRQILKESEHLVFNIGSGKSYIGAKYDKDNWIKSFDINFLYILDILTILIDTNYSHQKTITFISSIAARRIVGAPIYYAAAKNNVHQIMKYLSVELSPSVRVNSIELGNLMHPTSVWNEKYKKDKQDVDNYLSKNVPMKNFVTPNQVASLIKLLVDKSMSSICGASITLDGGQSIV